MMMMWSATPKFFRESSRLRDEQNNATKHTTNVERRTSIAHHAPRAAKGPTAMNMNMNGSPKTTGKLKMNQDLRQDRKSPAQALIVRLMLSACGCSQLNCGEFIRSENFEFFPTPTRGFSSQVFFAPCQAYVELGRDWDWD
eukprot:scaffold119495_cov48-Attheya_sp.AAC.1